MFISDELWDKLLFNVKATMDFLEEVSEGEDIGQLDEFKVLLKRYDEGERSLELYKSLRRHL